MNDSYRNPFSAVNAVQMEIDSILEYWCNPFTYDLFSEIKQADIYEDPMNIVFMGGRSTGKSMFLRYWSYPVQFKAAEKDCISFTDVLKRNKGIGFYFRIDGPALRSFQGHGLSEEHWTSVFTHYFELIIGRQLIEVLRLLQGESSIRRDIVESGFISKMCKYLDFGEMNTLDEVIEEFDKRIQHVDRFRGNVPFHKQPFDPGERGFASQSISISVSEMILTDIASLRDLHIVLLLDEYENFLEYQQVVVNTLLRFTRPKIKFRIGMRLEGFRTFKMIADEDFIKEGREYRKVVFEEVLNKDLGYHKFLVEIARKRLESIAILREKQFTNIRIILSREENLEDEAIELTKKKPNKTYEFFSKKLPRQQLDRVRCPDNPLLELMNFVWLTRGVSAEKTSKSMNDYLAKKKTEDAAKYRLDYVDKYKLSLMFLLCSIYRRPKLYYSFNTFAFLSSGIVGHFIELCRRSFAIAGWGDDRLVQEGKIARDYQSQAAREFSTDELHQISRIENYGAQISRFIHNIGNVFRDYHLDFGMRYPETNQFAVNLDTIQKDLRDAMEAAIRWSVIQRKPKIQRKGPGEHLQDTYTINRIFSPSFSISYRTRGGKSVSLNEVRLNELMNVDDIDTSQYITRAQTARNESADDSPTLFSHE